jgi:hypothetical protein
MRKTCKRKPQDTSLYISLAVKLLIWFYFIYQQFCSVMFIKLNETEKKEKIDISICTTLQLIPAIENQKLLNKVLLTFFSDKCVAIKYTQMSSFKKKSSCCHRY